eukprot:TRINITY_DN6106_c0_g1_i1.p1 TRINITY_DN6106_c0_g1~~TRINITY_DN6106_c0_g1_i1.p1  ORF type:complete len:155 (-),score=62.93 TRINITY_DN6106_c0_g1_i1:41-505(-)
MNGVEVIHPTRREGGGELVRMLEDFTAKYQTQVKNMQGARDQLGEAKSKSRKNEGQQRIAESQERMKKVSNFEYLFDHVITQVELLEKEIPYKIIRKGDLDDAIRREEEERKRKEEEEEKKEAEKQEKLIKKKAKQKEARRNWRERNQFDEDHF